MDRLRVVLLDDEVLIRKLVRMKLNTEALHLEIVGEFSSAGMAVEKLEELKPDIIISDICMPGVDGISFSEQCTGILPDIKIIILTGYNDFEYARRSVKAGVNDYLMKPVQTEELNASVERLAKQIREEKRKKEAHRKMLEERQNNIPLLRNTYISRLLLSDEIGEDIIQKLAEYGVSFAQEEERVQLGVVMVQESLSDHECLMHIYEEAQQFFKDEQEIHVVADPWGRIIFLGIGENDSFWECFDLLLELLREKYQYHFRYGTGTGKVGIGGVRALYVLALEDMYRRYDKKQTVYGTGLLEVYENDEFQTLVDHISGGNTEEALAALPRFLDCLGGACADAVCSRQGAEQILERICIRTGQREELVHVEKALTWCRCGSDLVRCLERTTAVLAMNRAVQAEQQKGSTMRELMAFLQENLDNADINMNYLASRYAISGSLLSRMFKRFTGRSYSELLSELRFWKMLELLATDAEMLDRDIGNRIGINDPHYLSIWFRKMTGYSVTEYRKMSL
ncbi:MAG: response regulator [Lachnospiraceae bacterium]|nr:response regulator [Lachnospiraceae bacterium]